LANSEFRIGFVGAYGSVVCVCEVVWLDEDLPLPAMS
jgi:hypothetical protein